MVESVISSGVLFQVAPLANLMGCLVKVIASIVCCPRMMFDAWETIPNLVQRMTIDDDKWTVWLAEPCSTSKFAEILFFRVLWFGSRFSGQFLIQRAMLAALDRARIHGPRSSLCWVVARVCSHPAAESYH